MRNLSAWVLVGVVLLSVSSTACSKRGNSRDLAALENAYKSGVLTKSEYETKKAAFESQAGPLAALDKALQVGVLTKDEYDARKTRLLSQAGPLAALDKARTAGILTKDEYESKRAALLAPDTSVPVDSPAAAVPEAPPTMAAASEPAKTAPPLAVEQPQPVQQSAPRTEPAPSPAGGDPQGHSYRLKMAKVTDAQGFERPMTSVTMLIPVDWQSQGSTTWNVKDRCNGIRTTFRAAGPDGRGYEIFPAFNWIWADDPRPLQQTFAQQAQMGTHSCDVMPIMGAQEYLRRNLAKVRPNAQLVGFEPAPKLMEDLAQQARQTEQSARQYNLTQSVKYDAIKARVKYTVDGKPVEEWVLAATVITGTLSPSLNIQTMQQTKAWTYNCVAYMGAQRAPQGQLDASLKFFELIGSTYRTNPEWQAKVSGNALALQQIELKGVRDRSAIVAKSADDTRIAQRQIYENQSRSEDRTSTQFSQYQRGVETYRNPSTGDTIDLDNNYGHAWVNNKGEYLLSDQAGFDPNTVFKNNEGWQQLQHVKK